MKDDPAEILTSWQLLLLVAWILVALPLAALVGLAIRWSSEEPPRLPCGNCGYAMVVLERECPQCRASRHA